MEFRNAKYFFLTWNISGYMLVLKGNTTLIKTCPKSCIFKK